MNACPWFLILAAAALAVPAAGASDLPDPEYCTVEPCDQMMGILTTPHTGTGPEATRFVVTVKSDPVTPVPNAYVEIIVGQPMSHLVCPGAQGAGYTNEHGQVTFNLAMGGCTLGQDVVRIYAIGVAIRIYGRLLSPDYDGQADGAVTLSDFTIFANAYLTGAAGCTDYYNDGTTGIDDLAGFGACWGLTCWR